MAIITQLLGPNPNVQAGIAKIRAIIGLNKDIETAINASVGASMPKTSQELRAAREKAIASAIQRNGAFAQAINDALKPNP